jgi:hypothetical protein
MLPNQERIPFQIYKSNYYYDFFGIHYSKAGTE